MPASPPADSAVGTLEFYTSEMKRAQALHPNNYNPNLMSDDDFYLLCLSIAEHGFTQSITVLPDGTIVDGEHRWTAAIVLDYLHRTSQPLTLEMTKAARARRAEILGEDLEIPVVPVSLDYLQSRVATLRHNRARGQEQVDDVAAMFRDFERLGALGTVGKALDLDQEEIDRMLAYGTSILDNFAAAMPSPAWEPQVTQPGQLQPWAEPGRAQSLTDRVATAPPEPPPPSTVPGLTRHDPDLPGTPPPPAHPLQEKRIFIFTQDEARSVDKALGLETGARNLLKLCEAYLTGTMTVQGEEFHL